MISAILIRSIFVKFILKNDSVVYLSWNTCLEVNFAMWSTNSYAELTYASFLDAERFCKVQSIQNITWKWVPKAVVATQWEAKSRIIYCDTERAALTSLDT